MQSHQATNAQPRILVIQNEFVDELKLALEYVAGEQDEDTFRDQMAAILSAQSISAAILDTGLDIAAAAKIAETLCELEIPFVFAGPEEPSDLPQHVMSHTMDPDLANLTILAQSILGKPTYH